MTPFFKDHTSYGAIIAFFLPFCAHGGDACPATRAPARAAPSCCCAMLTAGLIFSYTRAAWLSLVGAIGVFLVHAAAHSRLDPGRACPGTAGGVVLVEQEQITIALERNREESSDDLGEHVKLHLQHLQRCHRNLERINRWNSALRMFEERPVFGWGPGTYMFQYAPFQASEDRTIISTNFGDAWAMPTASTSGPLSEQGMPGIGLMLALVIVTMVTGMRLYATHAPGCGPALDAGRLVGPGDLLPARRAQQLPRYRQGLRAFLGLHGDDRALRLKYPKACRCPTGS